MPKVSKIDDKTLWFHRKFIRITLRLGISHPFVPIFFYQSRSSQSLMQLLKVTCALIFEWLLWPTLLSLRNWRSNCFRIPKLGRPLPQLSRLRIGNDAQIRHSVGSFGIQGIWNAHKRPVIESSSYWASQFAEHRVIEIQRSVETRTTLDAVVIDVFKAWSDCGIESNRGEH